MMAALSSKLCPRLRPSGPGWVKTVDYPRAAGRPFTPCPHNAPSFFSAQGLQTACFALHRRFFGDRPMAHRKALPPRQGRPRGAFSVSGLPARQPPCHAMGGPWPLERRWRGAWCCLPARTMTRRARVQPRLSGLSADHRVLRLRKRCAGMPCRRHRYRLWVAVRCGGHTTGYSVNDGMVVDLSEMRGVVLDRPAQRVHVLPGTDFDHFNAAMNHTGWHVPTGPVAACAWAALARGGATATPPVRLASRAIWSNPCAWRWRTDASSPPAQAKPLLYWAMRGGTGATSASCCR